MDLSAFNVSPADLLAALTRLRPAWELYTRTVSPAGHALSLEAGALVACLCSGMRPRSIVDLGSGFSSYVVRSSAPVSSRVSSVDDSPEWLARSVAFCTAQGVPTGGFSVWSDFVSLVAPGTFDLVVYDLGRMPVRDRELPAAMSLVAPGGLMVIDDMHKFNYSKRVRTELAAQGWWAVSLYDVTVDAHEGRHSWLAQRPA